MFLYSAMFHINLAFKGREPLKKSNKEIFHTLIVAYQSLPRCISQLMRYARACRLKSDFSYSLSALDQYGRSPFRSGNNSKFSTIQTVFSKKMRETISFDIPQGTVFRKKM